MPTPVFALVATDLKKRHNPSNLPTGFLGTQSTIATTDVDESLFAAEDKLLGELSERQRELMRHVDGEIVVQYAQEGQTTFQLGLFPATNVKLFKNWNFKYPWNPNALQYAMDSALYTVDSETGAGTLTQPLSSGDALVAVYDHTAGSKMHHLRDVALDYAASKWAMYIPSYSDSIKQMWEDRRRIAYGEMRALAEGKNGGLDVLDNLVLARETRSPLNDAGEFPILGGW